MLLGQFREAVRPAGGNAVRRRGIQNARIAAFRQRDGFSCSSVRQAENGNVGGVNGFASGIGVLALFLRERQERKLPALRQPIENPKACCAFLAINKDRPCHDIPPPFMRNRRINIQTYYTHIGALVKRKSRKKSFRALIADSEPARVRHPLRNGRLHRRDGRVPELRCALAGEIPFAAGNPFIL